MVVRGGPMVFGRHCVRSIAKNTKKPQQQQTTTATTAAASIQTVINKVTSASRDRRRHQETTGAFFKPVMTLKKGVFCQLLQSPPVVTRRGSLNKVDFFPLLTQSH